MNRETPTRDFDVINDTRIICIDAQRSYNVALRSVRLSDKSEVKLTPAEHKIYLYLLDNPGHLMTLDEILNHYEADRFERDDYEPINKGTLPVIVTYMRKKFDCDKWNPIRTQRRIGYMANMDFDEPSPEDRVDLAEEKYIYGHQYDGVYFDKRNNRIYREGYGFVQLTNAQSKTLSNMFLHPRRIFTKKDIVALIASDFNNVAKLKTANVHVCHIRETLKHLDLPTDLIRTVHGSGYEYNSRAFTPRR